MIVDGIEVIVNGKELPEEEIKQYVKRGQAMYSNLDRITLHVPFDDEEMIEIGYHIKNKGFERLRRITGYLVGTMDRWNNSKRAEERDRVKHSVEV